MPGLGKEIGVLQRCKRGGLGARVRVAAGRADPVGGHRGGAASARRRRRPRSCRRLPCDLRRPLRRRRSCPRRRSIPPVLLIAPPLPEPPIPGLTVLPPLPVWVTLPPVPPPVSPPLPSFPPRRSARIRTASTPADEQRDSRASENAQEGRGRRSGGGRFHEGSPWLGAELKGEMRSRRRSPDHEADRVRPAEELGRIVTDLSDRGR